MSMLQYPLYHFLAKVPSCLETSTLAMVLEIFEQEQCDRLVVVNQQQHPLGLVHSARLTQKLLAVGSEEQVLDWQQPLSSWEQGIIDSLKTLPATYYLEQLELLWPDHRTGNKNNLDWALIDQEGKFLGLLNSSRVLRVLAQEKLAFDSSSSQCSDPGKRTPKNTSRNHANTSRKISKTHWRSARRMAECKAGQPRLLPALRDCLRGEAMARSGRKNQYHSAQKSLVQLLEILPWPLMLQTGTGEIVAQNPAWWEQLGVLKDPEGIRDQVEAILTSPDRKPPTEYTQARRMSTQDNEHPGESDSTEQTLVSGNEPPPVGGYSPLPTHSLDNSICGASARQAAQSKQSTASKNKSNHCFLDSQMGTCTCVVEVHNGSERIWQFAKIILDHHKSELISQELNLPELNCQQTEANLGIQGSNHLCLVLATDVTEQQQIYKELAAKNADLIQLNRLKDEFLACISHELKTPLTAVLGLSRLLVDQQLGELNERQARYAGLIHQSGRHLMSVVNDILDLTRMETGQMDLALVPVKIRAVCDRAITEAKAIHTQTIKAKATPVANSIPQLAILIEPDLDEIVADELRLRQMLVHLLSNAFKFTENSGEIGLRVSRWEGWIAFTVWDTGIGIPEHQQHLIFQKFQQLENPLTRQFEGTGLGLVLTRALARLHGGDVSFLSREGKGSQFTLLLPPSPPTTGLSEPEIGIKEHSQIPTPQTPEVSSCGVRGNAVPPGSAREILARRHVATTTQHQPTSSQRLVLVVEAVARYIEDLTDKLKGLGYRVVIARSGTEAVEKARRLQPKVIFLNPLLPLLSGWDVLTLLKSDVAIKEIPVIVTATGAEKEQVFAHGGNGFLNLPVQDQALVPLLENLCTQPATKKSQLNNDQITPTITPLRILRLVEQNLDTVKPHPSLREHRVIEVDDLDQAELLAQVWQFDVILLDVEGALAQTYLEELAQHPILANIPLVTCDVATTLAASQIPGLSVFPYLRQLSPEQDNPGDSKDALLSVLQIASGICCPPSILVVDLTMLDYGGGVRPYPDIAQVGSTPVKVDETIAKYSPNHDSDHSLQGVTRRGSEWFQALIQYLQTAGLKASMSRSWAEVIQQIRHQSVDLLLICLGDSSVPQEVLEELTALAELPLHLPPILIIDQRLSYSPRESLTEKSYNSLMATENLTSELAQFVVGIVSQKEHIAPEILPRSISMEDLLAEINQALGLKADKETRIN
ncbi:ATP-binding protein [Anabaenopsis elenkinii]|uniref:histidine kinase n=1 Tax=Anabaenopsis elenkinii CCIBt3563 TaxID=2779889 RepID=A0A7S6U567_9CYAN|nr:ATP-binding protein [Anabaenopsis elenkinii]QOV24031.1 hybrid sensor histidine kinase/response regulator [Anabaenopsis elenkinii CCIBt3563]